jgi:hypothetical protein
MAFRLQQQAAMTMSRSSAHRLRRQICSSFVAVMTMVGFAGAVSAADNLSTDGSVSSVRDLPRFYLTVGAGPGFGPRYGNTVMGALTVGSERFQVSGRMSRATEFVVLGPAGTNVNEYGLMAGIGRRKGPAHLYAAAGLGAVDVDRRGRELPSSGDGWQVVQYERVKKTVVNVPVQVGADFDLHYIAGGLALMANLNSAASQFCALLTVSLGKMRNTETR